ncbi:MAG: APC family permease [Oryzihumus sp.]
MTQTASAPTTTGSSPHLRRDIGFWGLTFVSLGSIIGSGWLLGALLAAQVAGPASIISWLMAGVFLAVLALVHAELGAAYPVSGGTARFPHIAFGSLAGFTSGWMGWLQAVTIAPIEVEAALSYTNNKLPGLVSTNGTLTMVGLVVASVLMLAFTIINIVGVKLLAETNTVTVLWKTAIPVLTVVVLLLMSFHSSNFHAGGGFAPFGAHGVMAALPAGVVFALQGFEQAIQMGGEARNPQRDISRAVITAMVIGTIIYLMLEVAFIGAINPANLAHGWANPIGKGDFGPYATLATGVGAGWLAALLYIDAVISPAGTGLLYLGTSARLSYALGHNRHLPRRLAKVSPRGVPLTSIVLAFIVGEVAFLPFPSWQSLVGLVTSATAIMYGFAPVALGALRRVDPDRPRPFRLPAAGVLSPLAFVAANFIVYWSGWEADSKLLIAAVIGLVLFGVNYVRTPVVERPVLDWRASAWVLPWLGGLAVISRLGQFGGDKVIPFWVDLVVVAAFSVGIYAWGARSGMHGAREESVLEDEQAEAGLVTA